MDSGAWTPMVLCDSEGAYWDGFTARDRNAKQHNALSEDAKEELTTMILDGHFGEAIKDAVLDQSQWLRVYDKLIDIPDPQAIAENKLEVMSITRSTLK